MGEGIAVYDLVWISNISHGIAVHNKWRCCIESDTKLPKKIEAWQRIGDEEYKLTTTAEFDYPTKNNIQLTIEEAGF